MTIRRSDGTFVKGSIPWNKGLHIDLSNGKGQFKKGTIPPQHHEVGYIAHHKDGYSFIKVADPKNGNYIKGMYGKKLIVPSYLKIKLLFS